MSYPEPPKSTASDKYKSQTGKFVEVTDPFRPLEDPDSPTTREWVEAEKKLTENFFVGDENGPKIEAAMLEIKE
jgi:prolyl oligopeptidase